MATGASLISDDPIVAVQGRDSVRFGHGWVVEGSVDEVHQTVGIAFLRHDGLPDMDDFSGLITKAVNSEQLQGFSVKQQLQHPGRLTGNLGTSEIFEESMANLVRYLCGC